MTSTGRRFAVVGGGISGLVAAVELERAYPRAEVVLLEADDRLGGKIRSGSIGGTTVDAGPDAFLLREPSALEVWRAAGIESELVRPRVFGGAVWTRGALRALPPQNLYGIPSRVADLVRMQILRPVERARAALDLVDPRRLGDGDVDVASLVVTRFGRAMLDHAVDPVLAGTRAGRAGAIGVAAALPELDAAARSGSSIMRGIRRTRSTTSGAPDDPGRAFHAPAAGMERLVVGLQHLLGGDVRLSQPARGIERADGRYAVVLEDDVLLVDGVVVATPAKDAAALLGSLAPTAARDLATIDYSSLAVVALVYPEEPPLPARWSGFLVPSCAGRTIGACTWYTRKWGRATREGLPILRAFAGRHGGDPAYQLADEVLVQRVAEDIALATRSALRPLAASVWRFPEALPQYEPGHLDKVRSIEAALAGENVALAGAALRGSGIPACVASARRAATHILATTAATTAR